ncbi:hypothetical protein [Alishewanella longhuensis]
MNDVMHQMSKVLERGKQKQGEALLVPTRDETVFPQQQFKHTGQGLLEQVLARENMRLAWQRVKANKGSAGVDGLTIAQTAEHLKEQWPALKAQLLNGSYRPQPVRRVGIPKSDGTERELGVPTVTDRLIQQALLQVLQPKLVTDIPAAATGLAQGAGKGSLPPGSRTFTNDYGSKAFGGACPPEGHGMHRYQFTVWALPEETLPAPDGASAAVVGFMLNAMALAKATLTATYAR